jgi:hypothetical protein
MTWDLWLMNVAVMGGSAAMDLLYVWWTRSVVADRRTQATAAAGLFWVVNCVMVAAFVAEHRLIPACVAGHMLGTWVAMHKGERR